jgi:hypothetical protein
VSSVIAMNEKLKIEILTLKEELSRLKKNDEIERNINLTQGSRAKDELVSKSLVDNDLKVKEVEVESNIRLKKEIAECLTEVEDCIVIVKSLAEKQ